MATTTRVLADAATGVLLKHGGVAHLQRFLHAGLSREHVAHLRHLGMLVRPRIGWYASPGLSDAALAALRVGGALGCVSAARSWGIVTPGPSRATTHVSLTRATTRMRRADDATARARAGTDHAARWHWETRLEPVAGWRVSPLDSLVQAASCLSFPWLVAAIDSARRPTPSGTPLTRTDLGRLRSALPERLRSAVDRSDARAESAGETFIRLGIEDAGIPFDLQVWLTSLYRADLQVGGWLPIESDGVEFHSSREAMLRDRDRDATLARLDTAPLRFSQHQAEHELPFVVDTIAHVWRRGRPR